MNSLGDSDYYERFNTGVITVTGEEGLKKKLNISHRSKKPSKLQIR